MIKDEKLKWVNVVIWLVSVLVMIKLMQLGSLVLVEDNFGLFIEFVVIALVTLLFIYIISGKKTFSYWNNQTGYTIKMLIPTLILPFIFGTFEPLALLFEKHEIYPNWPVNLLLMAANMFLVGIYEEGCFRVCACDALLPALKKTKHPFLLTVLISGFVFGYAHVVWVDFANLQETLQFILKIANVGLTGAAYMILYWKTRNLLGIAIVHGLNDLLPDFFGNIFVFENANSSDAYVTGDVDTTVVYLIQFVFLLAAFIFVYKKVGKTIDYEKTLEEW